MFIISHNKKKIDAALQKVKKYFSAFKVCSEIKCFKITDTKYIGWLGCRLNDNLHRFNNGWVMGPISLNEKISLEIINHDSDIPNSINKILGWVKIFDSGIIQPNYLKHIFYSKDTISDMQILVAKVDQLSVSQKSFFILASCGYYPGNISLFQSVNKIPILNSLNFYNHQLSENEKIKVLSKNFNDIPDIIFEGITKTLPIIHALSGGVDSRFVLAGLHKYNLNPKILSGGYDENERGVAVEIANVLNYKLNDPKKIDSKICDIHPFSYSILTDCQTLFGAGKWSIHRSYYDNNHLLSHGYYADCTLKNGFNQLWKLTSNIDRAYKNHINNIILFNSHRVKHFLDYNRKELEQETFDYLNTQLYYQRQQFDFQSVKELSCWLYFMNRGLRWTEAMLAEVSLYAYPISFLSNIDAVIIGAFSPLEKNQNYRLPRHLINQLLPEIKINYNKKLSYKISNNYFQRKINSIWFEYIKRGFKYFKGKRIIDYRYSVNQKLYTLASNENVYNHCNIDDIKKFYENPKINHSFKRAIITLSHAYDFIKD